MAYPAHDILDKENNPMSGAQFTPRDRFVGMEARGGGEREKAHSS
jgi:hypothetical protein